MVEKLQTHLSYGVWLSEFILCLAIPKVTICQWVPTNGPSVPSGEVEALGVNGSTLFAEVNGLVYRSTDESSSWIHAESGLSNHKVEVFAADASSVFAATDSGVYRSTNEGISWSPVNSGISVLSVNALTVSDSSVLAGTNMGIFRSTDDGTNWSPGDSGLVDSSITALASNRGRVYAGSGNGLYLSTDGGVSWNRLGKGIIDTNVVMVVAKDSDLFVSAGGYLYGSSNAGATWDSQNKFSDVGITTLAIIDTTIFAAENMTDGNFAYVSTDNGVTWSLYQPLRSQFVEDIMVSGTDLFAGSYIIGLFRSTDDGVSWTHANNGLVTGSVNAMASSGNEVIVSETGTGSIFLSTDQGIVWTQVDSGVHASGNSLAVSNSLALGVGYGIFRSTDSGVFWTMVDSTITSLPQGGITFCGSDVFAATSKGVSVSHDGGGSWTVANFGLFSQNVGLTQDVFPPIVFSLAALGTNLLAGTYGSGMFKSTDYGTDWVVANDGLPMMEDTIVEAMATCGTNVFASIYGAGVYLSTDEGTSWTQINNGLNGDVESFTVSDTIVFAGCPYALSSGVFVFRSRDKSWIPENTGLLNLSVLSLAASDGELYAGFHGGGVWKRPISEMVIDAVHDGRMYMPSGFKLYQNYPNPFNPTTTIAYDLPTNSQATVKIYDVLGREIKALVNERQSAGNHTVTFDASDLPSGVYFYRLQAASYSATKKLVLLK